MLVFTLRSEKLCVGAAACAETFEVERKALFEVEAWEGAQRLRGIGPGFLVLTRPGLS